jgi:hypothetical protein
MQKKIIVGRLKARKKKKGKREDNNKGITKRGRKRDRIKER